MKIPLDKLLHFAGCIMGMLVLSPNLPLDTTTYIMLGVALGVELGDLKNYGCKQLKDKATRAPYLVNTILDLFADVWGIAVAVVLIRIGG